MTITELVEKLIEFRSNHGDLPTVTFDESTLYHTTEIVPVVDNGLKVVKALIS